MISLPYLKPIYAQQNVIYQFSGLDRRERIPDGAAREMTNLSLAGLPCLTVRERRGKVKDLKSPTLLAFKNGKQILIDGEKLIVDGAEKAAVQAGKKCWAIIGQRVCIWPDKILYDALNDAVEPLGKKQISASAKFTKSTLELDADVVFKKGDGVTISGCSQAYNNRTVVIQAVEGRTLTVYDNVFQYGELGSEQKQDWEETNITLERVVPDLDFVCEKDNRLWGTHGNAVCCCKLGDPKNWNVFNGLSTDAWESEVGSDGKFTGIAAFSSHVIAFKEHLCHKIYGTKPSSLQLQVAHIEGVKQGCEQSIVNINENIFYLSHSGVMVYAGGIPDCISPQLTDDYTQASGGRFADKYYFCGKKHDGSFEMLVFDTAKNIWVKEDHTQAVSFAEQDGKLYWITPDALWCNQGDTEREIPWCVMFGEFERVTAKRQFIFRMHLMIDLSCKSRVLVEMKYDDGNWVEVTRIRNAKPKSYRIPIIPRRCARFAIRLSGVGNAVIRSIEMKLHEGSDHQ